MRTINEIKKEYMRKVMLNEASQYVKNGVFDSKEFFLEYPSYRARMVYYFGSTHNFYKELGFTPEYKYQKLAEEKKKRKKQKSLRNQLAYERLYILLENRTLDEIGALYGVSKQAVHNLMTSLDIDNS